MAFVAGFGIALLLTPAAGAVGRAMRLVDRPGDVLKIHAQPIPVVGGVGVVAATFAAYAVVARSLPLAPVAAALMLLAIGLLDDARTLPPSVRLVGQASAGAILVAGGLRLEPLGPAGVPAAVLVVVLSANAVNMMDGQDGLVGGLGAIAALGLAGLAAWNDAGPALMLALSLAGALAAFLLWNRPPARIFLGNGGAYAVGVLLAVIGMMIALRDGWRGLLAAGACLGVFAFEVVYTVLRRVASGRAVVPGDRFHSYDVTAILAGGRARSTGIFWVLGAAAAALGLAVGRLPLAVGGPVLAVASVAAAVGGGLLFRRTRAMERGGPDE
ncbi:MAG TPA: hypothetical protein VHL78_02730 [Actinomycetota bacterium]|nr:hypothetical protein [Actinomycetota bacterium]